MASVRNVSNVDRYVPALDAVVESDSVVQVPDDDLDGYICQPDIWRDESASADPVKAAQSFAPNSNPSPPTAHEPDTTTEENSE